jgi:hypothetical protein
MINTANFRKNVTFDIYLHPYNIKVGVGSQNRLAFTLEEAMTINMFST